uniref:Uncharacterized protein n=1 Tax=viral metagenome TaxID=1070528 RepID=A0A6C0JI95_9ZZZZ
MPSTIPSGVPFSVPSGLPSNTPSDLPFSVPSGMPSNTPSDLPFSVPSEMPSNPPSSQQSNEQLLNDIKSLQTIESDLFSSLETNPSLTTQQQQQIITKINSISQMRINLYQTLGEISGIYQNALVNSQGSLKEQSISIGIVEKQLNETKKKLEALELEKNNKIRLIEINDYYGEKYNEHSSLMKYIIFMLIPIIIITFLFNKGLLPKFIFYILLVVIAIIGSIFIVYRLLSIWSRDNMNYQEYAWSFNVKNAPSVINNNGSNSDPWSSGNSAYGTCIGDNCCSTGMTYDTDLNQCVTSNSTKCSQLSKKESFMNNILTQKSSLYKKPDITLNNNIMPSNY